MTMLEVHHLIGEQMTRLCDTRLDRSALLLEVERSMAFSSLTRDYIRCAEVILEARSMNIVESDAVAHLIM